MGIRKSVCEKRVSLLLLPAVERKGRKSDRKEIKSKEEKVIVKKHACKQEKGKRPMGKRKKKLEDARSMWKEGKGIPKEM